HRREKGRHGFIEPVLAGVLDRGLGRDRMIVHAPPKSDATLYHPGRREEKECARLDGREPVQVKFSPTLWDSPEQVDYGFVVQIVCVVWHRSRWSFPYRKANRLVDSRGRPCRRPCTVR